MNRQKRILALLANMQVSAERSQAIIEQMVLNAKKIEHEKNS